MTREEAAVFLHKLERGQLTLAERRRIMEQVLLAILRRYAGAPSIADESGPVALDGPTELDRLVT